MKDLNLCPNCKAPLELHYSDGLESNVRIGGFEKKCPNCNINLVVTVQMVPVFKVRVK